MQLPNISDTSGNDTKGIPNNGNEAWSQTWDYSDVYKTWYQNIINNARDSFHQRAYLCVKY